MWYWNQNYFEGLREVAETYAHRPNFKLFSKYCRLKEEGHKKAANAESVKFVMHTSELPLEQRREIAAELAELGCLRPSIHSLINHPIEQFVRDTLKKWVADVKRIQHLLYIAEYKRRQAPPGVKISSKNFGKDRRYPITNGYRDLVPE